MVVQVGGARHRPLRQAFRLVASGGMAVAVMISGVAVSGTAYAADETEHSVLASFDFNELSSGQTGVIEDSTGSAKATLAKAADVSVSNGYEGDGSQALSFADGQWLNVVKSDGTPLLAGLDDVTISYDVYTAASAESQGWAFYASRDATAPSYPNEHYLAVNERATQTGVQRWNNSGSRDNSGSPSVSGLTAGWRHIELRITNDVTELYVNGELLAQKTPTASQALTSILGSSGGIVQLGKANWVSGEYFSGVLDNVEITTPKVSLQQRLDAFDANYLSELTADASLPKTLADGTPVDWEVTAGGTGMRVVDSGDSDTLDALKVDQPAYGAQDIPAVLRLSATVDGVSASRDIPSTVKAKSRIAPKTGYMFAYFTGDNAAGQKIFFSKSNGNNILDWSPVNNGQAVLSSTYGDEGLRDPFIMRSQDGGKFYMLATDLQIGRTSWGDAQSKGSLYLEIWESTDLVNWGEQRHVKVSSDLAGMTWAPEAYWDDEAGEYVVYWSSRLYADAAHTVCQPSRYSGESAWCGSRVMMATTKDFVNFTQAKVWQDSGKARIDSTVAKGEDGYYYRFTKAEDTQFGAQKDIFVEKSKNLQAVLDYSDSSPRYCTALTDPQSWCMIQEQLWNTTSNKDAARYVEGPSIMEINDGDSGISSSSVPGVAGSQYMLFVDDYGGPGYMPLVTDDIVTEGDANQEWTYAGAMNLNGGAKIRHGSALGLTASEYASFTGTAVPDVATTTDPGVEEDQLVTAGQQVHATVSAADNGELAGSVEFFVDGASIGKQELKGVSGSYQATMPIPADLQDGKHTIRAEYLGFEELQPSVSQTRSVRIDAGKGTVDTSALKDAVDKASALQSTAYTADSWRVLTAALQRAQAVLSDASSTQEQVDAALTGLQKALGGLVTVGGSSDGKEPGTSGKGGDSAGQAAAADAQDVSGKVLSGALPRTGANALVAAVLATGLACMAALVMIIRHRRREGAERH